WRSSADVPETWAARWAGLFPADDRRASCRWTGRFAPAFPVIHLYSRSEDVLSPPPADDSRWPGILAVADHGAWIYQEATKGRWPGRWVNRQRSQAGWAPSPQFSRRLAELSRASGPRRDLLLRTRPLFADPRDGSLLHPDLGRDSPGSRAVARRLSSLEGLGSDSLPSGASWTQRDEFLAHAAPSLTPPAGSVPLAGARGYRMDGVGPQDSAPGFLAPFPLGWPSGIEVVAYLDAPAPIWRHSDIKNVAFPHVHPAFAFVVREADLGLPDFPPP
ncbi:MAG: hypothetical protein ACKN9V_05580, partial [Pseudomonadota bacterium]